MPISVNDIVRVTLSFQQANSSLPQMVFFWQSKSNAESDSEIVADWAHWAENVWGAAWEEFASAEVSIAHVGVDVVGLNGHVLSNIGAETLAVPGTVSGDPVTAATAGYLLGYTPFPKSRGSKYVVGAAKDGIADNKFQSVLLAALVEMLAVYLLEYAGIESGANYVPGVVRRVVEQWTDFNGTGYVTDIPAYQRRRKPNVGS